MRPLRLKLNNFTAFRAEQEIDFTDLDLFALWGPIGSGKSSILDAMTYALYGEVDRVGTRMSQLISQGQPRMAVSLDFKVGRETLRVSRSTPASGSSKALLERLEGDDWQTYGPGADSVRGVNSIIRTAVGLDYDAFTRSVVLPQGKFAQFLVGDEARRRDILTELLGLDLFERMAERSNQIARDARSRADTHDQIISTQFGDVTEDAVAAARRDATEAADRAARLATSVEKLVELCRRDRDLQAAIDRLSHCAQDVGAAGATFASHDRALGRHIGDLGEGRERRASALVDVEKAKDAFERATRDVERAVERWGTRDDLIELRATIQALEQARAEVAAVEGDLATITRRAAETKASATAAEQSVARAETGLKEAKLRLMTARQVHDHAHRRDLVGSLVGGLGAGDPCPICERPLDSVPEVDVTVLEAARAELAGAETDHEHATDLLGDAKRQLALAHKDVSETGARFEDSQFQLAARAAHAADLFGAVTAKLGSEVDDPRAEVKERLAELEGLESAALESATDHKMSIEILQARDEEVAEIEATIDRVRTAMAHAGLDRTRRLVTEVAPDLALDDRSDAPLPEGAAELGLQARAVATSLQELASALDDKARSYELQRAELVMNARLLAGTDETPEASVEELTSAARAAADDTRATAVRSEAAATALTDQLTKLVDLRKEMAAARAEQQIYETLGRELRRDRIIDYLQAEALIALAEAGSRRLQELSGERYRLAYEDDLGFSVVDAWNGEERRGVKTLSGGETFLASLALALALSEQVQLLAVTEHHRLESLFLDEGFGNLDAETLEVVVAAIEQLGGEDRLVGVITHVTEVAERLPVRIEVNKSPRGSTLSVEGR
jgi:exonuclease SbcC